VNAGFQRYAARDSAAESPFKTRLHEDVRRKHQDREGGITEIDAMRIDNG
jgi:hypothetical protein